MKFKFNYYFLSSILLLILSLVLFFNPKFKRFINTSLNTNSREILAKIETKELHPQLNLTLIKIKQNQKLFLEVYAQMNHGLELIEKLNLDGEFDAFLMLKERTSNLLISNIDRDSDLEIIVPTYNYKMKPILNVFKYNSNLEEFRKVNSKYSKPIL